MIPTRALAFVLVAASATLAQDDEFTPPEDLMPFWRAYVDAKGMDDEERMDKVTRQFEELAIETLDVMLDDLCVVDKPVLHGEARTLAWSLDRVKGQEQYIERVRLVLDLEMADRRKRSAGAKLYAQAVEARRDAEASHADEDHDAASSLFDQAIANFEAIGDHEYAVNALYDAAMHERARNRPWEASRYLDRIAVHGEALAYREPLVDDARRILARLVEQGIDPRGEKPGDVGMVDFGGAKDRNVPEGGGEAEGESAPRGGGLSSFKTGSAEQHFELEPVEHKKVPTDPLPTLHPFEQYIVWPVAWVDAMGPSEFDISRNWRYQPFGGKLALLRTSLATFAIDADADGQGDVEFTPSTNPTLIDIPDPAGGPPMPLLVATIGDREMQFGVEVNLSPQERGARLRFASGQHVEGKALGTTLRIFDTNVSGRYGDAFEGWDDLTTLYVQDDSVYWVEPDAVVIGNAKRGVPWSKVLEVDGAYHLTDLSPDGLHLSTRALDLPTGELQVELDVKAKDVHLVAREVGALEGAFFEITPERKGKPVTLPAGTYQIASGAITSGKKTSMNVIRIYQGTSAPFTVEPGKTTTLELGAPYTLRFDTYQDGEELVVDGRSLRVFGRGGEEYAMFYEDPPQPDVEVRDSKGRKVGKPTTMRRPDLSHWQLDEKGNILWFPLDERIENPGQDAYEVQLSQKSHKLLGGPLTSDWTR